MSSGKPKTGGSIGSTMQSGSGGIKKEPADEGDKGPGHGDSGTKQQQPKVHLKTFCHICSQLGHDGETCPQKPKTTSNEDPKKGSQSATDKPGAQDTAKDSKIIMKCWICKAQGQHTTRNCPAHPKNEKKYAPTPKAAKTKTQNLIKMMRAENKCLYCGVEGHSIKKCPVKNWGTGPAAESTSQNQAGSSQGVNMEAEKTPQMTSRELPLSVLTEAISTDTNPIDQQPGCPQIVPGSVVSLTDEPKRVDSVRLPGNTPLWQIELQEEQALQALAAFEEKPSMIKRERADAVDFADEDTQPLPSPPSQSAEIFPEEPLSPSQIKLEPIPSPEPTISTESLPSNLKLVPSPRIWTEIVSNETHPSLARTRLQYSAENVPEEPLSPSQIKQEPIPSPESIMSAGIFSSNPKQIPSPHIAAGSRFKETRPPPARTQQQYLDETMPEEPLSPSRIKLEQSPFPEPTMSAAILPSNTKQVLSPRVPAETLPKITQPLSKRPLLQYSPEIMREEPLSPIKLEPIPSPELTITVNILPPNKNPAPNLRTQPETESPPPRTPLCDTQGSTPSHAPTLFAQNLSLNSNPNPPQLIAAEHTPADTTAQPEKKKRKRRGARRNGGSRLPDGTRMPKYVPAKVRAERAALAAAKKNAQLQRKRTGTTEEETQPNPSPSLAKAIQYSAETMPEKPLSPSRIKLLSNPAPKPTISVEILPLNLKQDPSSCMPVETKSNESQSSPAWKLPRYTQGSTASPTSILSEQTLHLYPNPSPNSHKPADTMSKEPQSSATTPNAPEPTTSLARTISAKTLPKYPNPTPPPLTSPASSLKPLPLHLRKFRKDAFAQPETKKRRVAETALCDTQGSTLSPAQTSAQILPPNPAPPLLIHEENMFNDVKAQPEKRKKKRRGARRNRGSKLLDGTRKPRYVPTRLREERAALTALRELERPGQNKDHTDSALPHPLQSPVPTNILSAQVAYKSPQPLIPSLLSIFVGFPTTHIPMAAKSAQNVPKQPQSLPSPAPHDSGPSQAPTDTKTTQIVPAEAKAQSAQNMPKNTQPLAPASPRIVQDRRLFVGPTEAKSAQNLPKNPQLPAPVTPRIPQGPRPSLAPTEAKLAQNVPIHPQSLLTPAPSRKTQDTRPSLAPTETKLTQALPKNPPQLSAPATRRIPQGPRPSLAPTETKVTQNLPKNPQIPAPATPRIPQELRSSLAPTEMKLAQIMPKHSQPLHAPALSRKNSGMRPSLAPTRTKLTQNLPKNSQESAPAPPPIPQGPHSSLVLTEDKLAQNVTKHPQPLLAPAPSRKTQGPRPSLAPAKAKSAKNVIKNRQPPVLTPPLIALGQRPSLAPTESKSTENVPNHPQPLLVPVHSRHTQDSRSSLVPTEAKSAQNEPKQPQSVLAPPHSRKMQGPCPTPALAEKLTQNVPKNPQPPTLAHPRILKISRPSLPPTGRKSAQNVPGQPGHAASVLPGLSQDLHPYPAATGAKLEQYVPNYPRTPAPVPPPVPQATHTSLPPTGAKLAQNESNYSRSPASVPQQEAQRLHLSPSPTGAKFTQNVPNYPRPPILVPPPLQEAQSPHLTLSPTGKKSTQNVPIYPRSTASVPPSVFQGSHPSLQPTDTKLAENKPIYPQQEQSTPPPSSIAPGPCTSLTSTQENPQKLSTISQPLPTRTPLRITLDLTSSQAPTQAALSQVVPTDHHQSSAPSVPELPPPIPAPLLDPPSPPMKLCPGSSTTATLTTRRKRKRRGVKRNGGNRIRDTGLRMPHYKPLKVLEEKLAAALDAAKQKSQELDFEDTAVQKSIQKREQPMPNEATVENTTGKPIPTRNSAELDEIQRKKQEIAKRRQEIKDQKVLYAKMLKAQLAMSVTQKVPPNVMPSAPVQNVQYPGFPKMVPNPVSRPPVPVTIVNHPNAAVQIPIPPGQNPVAPVRNITPVNVVEPPKPAKETPKPTPVNMMHHFTTINHYPAGVPRSFLKQEYQDQLNKHQLDQIGFQIQEQQLMTQEKQIDNAANKFPQKDSSEKNAEGFVPIQENSKDSERPQAYSPSDVYGDMRNESGSTEPHEGSESPDPQGQKRLSAFKRLGPVTAPKKPKLTINLKCSTDQAVREVVDETEPETVEEYTPVHLRNDVTTSTDETVMKYLFFWPWKKAVPVRRTASFKTSKSAMLLEQEQMEEQYDKDSVYIKITVTNYPKHWTKEDLFDVLLEQVNVIPCFIEFTSQECKFLVVRAKSALLAIHKMGFKLRKEDLELNLSISVTVLTQNQIEFVPRLVLRRRLNMAYDVEGKLDLQEFTLKSDLSHFLYFPLRRLSHQTDLIQLQSVVEWDRLTELNLSHNRLTSIDGFHLNSTTPHLKKLDVSYNYIEKVTSLIRCRNLPLTSISLEGNPLCHDYTDPAEYVKVVRMLFPGIRTLDGVTIHLKGDLPTFNKNFCVYGAGNIVEKFLETFYPLLEAQPADRLLIDEMYDENALMTVIYRYKFIHRQFRISSSSSKFIDDGVKDIVEGAGAITKYINKWPGLKHDPFTFNVDVLFHSDTTTIIKTCGMLKLTSENLAEDEPVISFSRTTLLHTRDGVEYKILNELLLWGEPSNECHDSAFQVTKIRSKKLYVDLEFESTPDEESKEKLIAIFGHLTELDKNASRRCLEKKEWNLRSALDNFIQLLKLNDLSSIIEVSAPRVPR